MHIGMTGARDGMTKEQKLAFVTLIKQINPTHLHHGDCVGADADAHDLATTMGIPCIIHPPSACGLRAFKTGVEMRKEFGYLTRNRHIVKQSEVLIGLPRTMLETKGGTWYTINYGKKSGKPVRIIYPDGSIEKFN